MQKRAPTLGNIFVIVLFVLSCFGLLLFLWEAFGGPLPLKAKGYRMVVAFPRALALAEQSDVRISGVDVGHVVSVKLGKEGLTDATIEIESRYAPLRSNMHAILRQKTLLGETYVQLIPKGNDAPYLPDGGRLAQSQVEPSVTLDDILSALDPRTRRAFQEWQQSVAEGINGQGEQINSGFAELEPFVENLNKLVTLLVSQEGAVTALVHNTGVVFNALAGRDHELEELIVNNEHTFRAAAAGSQAFAQAFRELPAFEHNSTVAFKELDKFAAISSPFLVQFQASQRQLNKLSRQTISFAPAFDTFLTALGPLTKAAKLGLPDVAKELNLTVPILENTSPVLHNFDPFLQYVGEYVPELQALFANVTAASEAHTSNSNVSGGPAEHYLRSMQVVTPQGLAAYAQRIGTDRGNPYFKPGVLSALASTLPVFSSSTCADSAPSVAGPANATVTQGIIEQLIELHVANAPESTTNSVPAPPCLQQSPFTFNGQTSQFPHVVYSGR
jgi:phospholipid/cholesterol/gamma-HCH transport system substrate-binding protein